MYFSHNILDRILSKNRWIFTFTADVLCSATIFLPICMSLLKCFNTFAIWTKFPLSFFVNSSMCVHSFLCWASATLLRRATKWVTQLSSLTLGGACDPRGSSWDSAVERSQWKACSSSCQPLYLLQPRTLKRLETRSRRRTKEGRLPSPNCNEVSALLHVARGLQHRQQPSVDKMSPSSEAAVFFFF